MKSIVFYITSRNLAALILILFCIQYIPIESRAGASSLKLAVSALCPFIWFRYSPKISPLIIILISYYFMVIVAAMIHPHSLRWTTIFYLGTFLITYITFYHLVVVEQFFSAEFFVKLLRGLIAVYFIFLVLQQCSLLIGIKTLPLINLVQDFSSRGIGGNALSYEPSSAAVIMGFAFLSLLRMREIDLGRKLSLIDVFSMERTTALLFLWIMITMASGTAFIALGIVGCYFMRSKYIIPTVLFIIIVALITIYSDYKPLVRAKESFIAFLTLDVNTIKGTDLSAAFRIVPIVNTINDLNLATFEGWFGHGVDYGFSKGPYNLDLIMIGNIADYGFISFLIMLIAVYTCMIKQVISLETVMWVGLGMMTLGNVPINWGGMMMFTAVRYFQSKPIQIS